MLRIIMAEMMDALKARGMKAALYVALLLLLPAMPAGAETEGFIGEGKKKALRVVDSESFRSFAMVGIDGQQLSFFPARSARSMYTEIALWGRSIRYSFVTFIIKSTPFF